MEKISVIIPSYNSYKTIRSCVLSVISTKYPALEIIIIDDASTDDSPHVLKQLALEYPQIVRFVRLGSNSGPANARNTGARYATGKYLFFLDSDTEMLNDALDNFIKRIEKADAVTGIYYYEPINRGPAQEYKALLNYYFFSRKGVIKYEVFDSSRAGISAEVFKEIGGFREDLVWEMDYENEEFGYRLSKKYINLLDPSVMVRHIFPDMAKLTKNYFRRVSLWMEIFLNRRRFESGGVTSVETGICTAALLFAITTLPLIVVNIGFCSIPLIFFLIYLYGYSGFFIYVFKQKRRFFPLAILLQIYFSIIIGLGAISGMIKVLTRRSDVRLKLSGGI